MKLTKWVCMFLLTWQTIFRVPDVATSVLFRFISMLLFKLSNIKNAEGLKQVYEIFPNSLKQAHKLQSIDRDVFKKMVVCSQCHATYHYEDCVNSGGVSQSIQKCTFVRFSQHQQRRMREPCDYPLIKTVKTVSGKQLPKPIKVFCYKSVIKAIEQLVQRPGMLNILNHWKNRNIPDGVMADIYDGNVWKSFLSIDGKDVLNSRYCFGMLINVDWFQPFKHLQYSVGAIYLAILNFPHRLWFHRENMILVGIIPGPKEPSLTMNSYLEPLVIDLLKLWKGIEMLTTEGKQMVSAILICNASDVPACRKVGGFVGHTALKACSRCLKSFPTYSFGEKADYSGFNTLAWPKRSIEHHRTQGMAWKHAQSLTDRVKIEREFGVRFTELLRLPYFDTIRFSVVDPMHNMLLGTAKHMLAVWKEQNLLLSEHYESIQSVVDSFVTPSDIGRIPHKISSGFSSFTADQWKNWTLIYSLVVLKTILPEEHYLCWLSFVQACNLLCSRAISQAAVNNFNAHLLAFCNAFQQLYGAQYCTPNMHFHCHLKECINDYGPANAFWLFACERLNGYLGSVPTNHQAIEVQLMRKFTSTQQVFQTLDESGDMMIIHELLGNFQGSKGSLRHEDLPEIPISHLSMNTVNDLYSLCKLVPPIREACFSSEELENIDNTLRSSFGDAYLRTLMLHKFSPAVCFANLLYGSVNSAHSKASLVYVKSLSSTYLPAFVAKYIQVNTLLNVDNEIQSKTIILANIRWLQQHEYKNFFGSPVEVWCTVSPLSDFDTYVPVASISCRCAYTTHKVKFNPLLEETVIIVVPIQLYAGF